MSVRLIVAALLLAVLAAALMTDPRAALVRSFLYFPLAQKPPPAAGILLGAEEVSFATADGLTLEAWFRPGPPGAATVIVFNGNAGDRSHRAPLGAALADEGFGVLLTDYRGYAGHPGTPSEEGLQKDARAALAYLRSRSEVDASRIAYFGESLGAAVAVELAVEHPPFALVLRSPFASLEDLARLHYPWFPAGPLLVERYGSIERIARVRAPLLVIAGTRDGIVPLEHSRRLFDAAGEPKRFVAIEGADHNDPELVWGPVVIEETARHIRGR